jgi:cytochrome c biogenesis protein
MSTISKQPPKRPPLNKQLLMSELTRKKRGESRLKQRVRFWLHHPLTALWGWLSSVRTAILLIAAIAVICLLGIYFQQAPGEVLNDPTAYAAWVQANELPHYGSLTPIFDWLQFYTIFSSWYFMLLMTILVLSIIVCTLNRAPAIWQNVRHPLLRRSDKFYDNALERVSFERVDALAWTTRELRKRGYRVRSAAEPGETAGGNNSKGEPAEITYLYANKNSWATLSTFVFHAALVTLLMAGVLSQWHGFSINSPARRILPAPLLSLSDSLAGFTFDQALPDGTSAMVYPRGTPHNISFRANSFKATFDPKTGLATDYVTDLSVYQDGVLVAHSNHLRVNDPLEYDGIIFHQSSLIPAVNLTISDATGCLVCNQAIVLDDSTTEDGLQVDLAEDIPIADTGFTLSVLFPHTPSLQLAQIAHPKMLVVVNDPNQATTQTDDTLNLAPGQSGTVNQTWKVTLTSASEATVLLVTKDTGANLIWPTAIILIFSLCITFYFPQRRIWVKITRDHIQLAALREHFINIRTDLLALEKASRQDAPPA